MKFLKSSCLLVLFLGIWVKGYSQLTKKERIETLIQAVLNDVSNNLYDMPAGVQRVVFFEVDSDIPKVYLRPEEMEAILTSQLTKMGIKVVFLPEFGSKINLKIRTTDSTIVIDNRRPVSRIKENQRRFNQVCQENNIQGLFRSYLHYDSVNGPKLTMSILHPEKRNLLWMRQVDLADENIVGRSDFSVNFGIGVQKINEIKISDTDTSLLTDVNAVPYIVGIDYLQFLNQKRSQQIGLSAKLRIVNQTPLGSVDTNNLGKLTSAFIPSVGIMYRVHFLKKKSVIPKYWMSFQGGLNYFNYNQSFLGLEQTLSVHLSNVMRLGVRMEQTLSNFDSYANDSKYEVKLDNINYAVQLSIHF